MNVTSLVHIQDGWRDFSALNKNNQLSNLVPQYTTSHSRYKSIWWFSSHLLLKVLLQKKKQGNDWSHCTCRSAKPSKLVYWPYTNKDDAPEQSIITSAANNKSCKITTLLTAPSHKLTNEPFGLVPSVRDTKWSFTFTFFHFPSFSPIFSLQYKRTKSIWINYSERDREGDTTKTIREKNNINQQRKRIKYLRQLSSWPRFSSRNEKQTQKRVVSSTHGFGH